MPAYKSRRRKYRRSYTSRKSKGGGVKKLFKLISYSVSGLLFFSIAFYLYTLTQTITKPFANASNGVNLTENVYDSKKPFTILLVSLENKENPSTKLNGFYLYHIDPTVNKSSLTKFNKDVKFKVSQDSEEVVSVENIYSSADLNNRDGLEYLIKLVKKNLAINVDAYLIYDLKSINDLEVMDILVNPQDLSSSVKYTDFLRVSKFVNYSITNILSDLSSVEILKLVSDTKSIPESNQNYHEFSNDNFSEEGFDTLWQQNTWFESHQRDRLSVTVLNAAESPGLASWGARVLKNSKLGILEVGNYNKKSKAIEIYTKNTSSDAVSYLNNLFNADIVKGADEFEYDKFLAERSDIIVVLGARSLEIY